MTWQQWLVNYSAVLSIASIVMFCIGLVVMRYAIVYMPADHFVRDGQPSAWWLRQHPVIRWVILILKNLLGAMLLLAGVVLSLPMIPGPGVMLMLVGISLMNLPGRRQLELWLVSFPAVHQKIDSLRARNGQQPLKLPEGTRR